MHELESSKHMPLILSCRRPGENWTVFIFIFLIFGKQARYFFEIIASYM